LEALLLGYGGNARPHAAAITLGGSSSVMRAEKTRIGYERYPLVLYQKLAAKRYTLINTSTERLDPNWMKKHGRFSTP
jgi:hypothetical protein